MALVLIVATQLDLRAEHPNGVVYQGHDGPGQGKQIVLIAGDHEYRSEEMLPALGRILAKHHGFKCSVFFPAGRWSDCAPRPICSG